MRRPLAPRRALAAILALAALPAPAQDAASIVDLICGRTVHYFNTDLGNQIEYTAADGQAYLWYSGAETLITGTWEVTALSLDFGQVCYVYAPGSFGPDDLGSTFCWSYEELLRDIPESGVREGDPYDLASGSLPFVLPFDRVVSVESLQERFPDQPPERACGLLMM